MNKAAILSTNLGPAKKPVATQLYAEAFYSNQEYYRFTRKIETDKKSFNKDTQIIVSTGTSLMHNLL